MTDALFVHGTVFDGARFLPAGTAVRISAGKVAAVGMDLDGAGAEIIDLAGGSLLPGFLDAHIHPVFAGLQLRQCDLRGSGDTEPDYLRVIAEYARARPDAEWITGGGWTMSAFPGGLPTREALDSVVPDRPVFLPNRDGHGAWVNTVALELAGIDKATPDPADGRIERDADGQPTGVLQEGAAGLVGALLPAITPQDWYQSLLDAQRYLLSLGVTGWQDAIVGGYLDIKDTLPTYLRALGEGELLCSVVGALWWRRDAGLDQLEHLVQQRELAGQHSRFRCTSVKMMLDGVAENHTAALLDPYCDGHGGCTDHSGLDFIDPHELPGYVTALDGQGFQVHFHALGDRAVRNGLDAVQAARRANGSAILHHLAHLQIVHPDDIPRFAALDATANIQALWATHEPQMDELTIPFLGEERAAQQYPFGDLVRAGAALCAGSDWPVSSPDPLLAAHVAVNRSLPARAGGTGQEPLLPEQQLDLATFLRAYTSGTAAVNGVADTVGSLKAGYDADLVIIDADLARLDAAEICDARVRQTWVRGDLVHTA